MRGPSVFKGFLVFLFFVTGLAVPLAVAQTPLFLGPDSLVEGGVDLTRAEGWRVGTGSRPGGEDPDLADDNWPRVEDTLLGPEMRERLDWPGHGWFRLELRVHEAWRGKEVALRIRHAGASDIFLNGRRVLRLGKVGRSPEEEVNHFSRKPLRFRLGPEARQVLAVHFSGFTAKLNRDLPENKGFSMRLAEPYEALDSFWVRHDEIRVLMAFFLGFFCVFALYHLQMYFFCPEQRVNRIVGLIGVTGAAISVVGLVQIQSESWSAIQILNQVQQLIVTCTFPLLIHYTYTAFRDRAPSWVWAWYGLIPLDFLLRHWSLSGLAEALELVALLEVLRQTVLAIMQGKAGSRILGVGILIVVACVLLEVLGLSAPIRGLFNQRVGLPFFGALILFILISFQASKKIGDTNTQLSLELQRVQTLSSQMLAQEREAREQEVARRLLEADNARKTEELEAARKLQLSMLPRKLPDHPHFEIAAFMATATEVGGDYYDIHEGEDGALTVAVGDATGHGSKAGTMVAAVKGLFALLAGKPDLPGILRGINSALRTMNLRGMFMAMALLRVEGGNIRYAMAGMPPLFIWRAASKSVETVHMKALPLGGVGKFPYAEKPLSMAPGDVLVAMSDGLPEMFNPSNAMLGEDRIASLIEEAVDKSPKALIEHLCQAGTAWRGSREQDDDLTLMILKAKS